MLSGRLSRRRALHHGCHSRLGADLLVLSFCAHISCFLTLAITCRYPTFPFLIRVAKAIFYPHAFSSPLLFKICTFSSLSSTYGRRWPLLAVALGSRIEENGNTAIALNSVASFSSERDYSSCPSSRAFDPLSMSRDTSLLKLAARRSCSIQNCLAIVP